MKHLKTVLTCLLLTFIVNIVTSCKDQKNPNEEALKKRTTEVKTIIKNIEDPQCKTSDEFVNNVLSDREKRRCATILDQLTLNEITEMCKVIIHREGYVDRKLFLKEYDESYQRVYKYIEEKDHPTENVDTLVDLQTDNANIKVTKHGTTSTSNPVHRE